MKKAKSFTQFVSFTLKHRKQLKRHALWWVQNDFIMPPFSLRCHFLLRDHKTQTINAGKFRNKLILPQT